MTDLAYHLHVVGHTFAYALCFEQFVLAGEVGHPLFEIQPDLGQGGAYALLRGHEYVGGIYLETVVLSERYAVGGVYGRYGFDLVAPEYDAQHYFLVSEPYVDSVCHYPEIAASEVDLVA